jgi:hypothetical protein
VIDPKSTAGVLLREHDNAQQALDYAERKFRTLAAMHNGYACDYFHAAEDLRKHLKNCLPPADYGQPLATFAA